jgi:hypothetical protein
MHIHPRTLLVAALGVAILAPVAYAQSTHAQVHAAGQAALQEPTPPLPPTLPPTANDVDAAPLQKPVRNDSDRVDTPMTPPVSAQGAAHAQAHSAVVQRDTWAKLDLDHDGRISASEAAVDADVNGMFAAMDSNNDGYVTDVEFRAHAKADMP